VITRFLLARCTRSDVWPPSAAHTITIHPSNLSPSFSHCVPHAHRHPTRSATHLSVDSRIYTLEWPSASVPRLSSRRRFLMLDLGPRLKSDCFSVSLFANVPYSLLETIQPETQCLCGPAAHRIIDLWVPLQSVSLGLVRLLDWSSFRPPLLRALRFSPKL